MPTRIGSPPPPVPAVADSVRKVKMDEWYVSVALRTSMRYVYVREGRSLGRVAVCTVRLRRAEPPSVNVWKEEGEDRLREEGDRP